MLPFPGTTFSAQRYLPELPSPSLECLQRYQAQRSLSLVICCAFRAWQPAQLSLDLSFRVLSFDFISLYHLMKTLPSVVYR